MARPGSARNLRWGAGFAPAEQETGYRGGGAIRRPQDVSILNTSRAEHDDFYPIYRHDEWPVTICKP
jgi:hypothetical protein